MPLFLNDEVRKQIVLYYTVLILSDFSPKTAKGYYEQIINKRTANDHLFADVPEVFGIPVEKVKTARDAVITKFKSLQDYDVILTKTDKYYPRKLAQTKEAPPFLFLRGNTSLLERSIISIVGTRHPTDEGCRRAYKLAMLLSERGIVIASGLATGIDENAHLGALATSGSTIAVIGTSLNGCYPKEHTKLQQEISVKGLLVSQFSPVEKIQRWNFPQRNATMSGLSVATIVIEAGETSGALIQADFALKQGRRVFIPQSAVENPNLKWPKKFLTRPGASQFKTIDELIAMLEADNLIQRSAVFSKKELITRAN